MWQFLRLMLANGSCSCFQGCATDAGLPLLLLRLLLVLLCLSCYSCCCCCCCCDMTQLVQGYPVIR
jgi:hypothetical protein